MDELLDVLDVFVDFGIEGLVGIVLGIVGAIAILVGLGLWVLTDMGLFVLPAALIVVGVLLLAVPSLFGGILELA